MEEGKKIAQADETYRKQQKETDAKKRDKALALHKELSEMKEGVKIAREQEKLKEALEDERAQKWVDRKSRQNELKKHFEDKWFK